MPIGLITATALVYFGLLVILLVVATRHLLSPHPFSVTNEQVEELSIERYRPMLGLLDRQELDSPCAHPGIAARMGFRVQRSRAFREYLGQMDDDFQRTSMALKVLIVQSTHDRPDLASALVRSQITFACRMMMVRFQLVLYRYGA
jgi:hypothetical protein